MLPIDRFAQPGRWREGCISGDLSSVREVSEEATAGATDAPLTFKIGLVDEGDGRTTGLEVPLAAIPDEIKRASVTVTCRDPMRRE